MPIETPIAKLSLAAALAAGVMASTPVLAQTNTQQPTTQQSPEQQAAPSDQTTTDQQMMPSAGASDQFPDDKLKSFAVAFLQVDKVTKQYLPKLKAAKSEDEQTKIRHEASGEMMKAVEGADGISVDEYNQIAKSAQTDPDLANKLTGYIRDASE